MLIVEYDYMETICRIMWMLIWNEWIINVFFGNLIVTSQSPALVLDIRIKDDGKY